MGYKRRKGEERTDTYFRSTPGPGKGSGNISPTDHSWQKEASEMFDISIVNKNKIKKPSRPLPTGGAIPASVHLARGDGNCWVRGDGN